MWDSFSSAKWYALAAIAVLWLCVISIGSSSVPSFIHQHGWVVAALAALTIANSLRSGLAWSLEPLLGRLTFVALTACAYATFVRSGGDTRPVARALALPLTLVVIIGLAQVAGLTQVWGLEPLFGLRGGDGRSATFGNANMAAQFVGFGAVFVLAHAAASTRPRRRSAMLAGGVLIVASVIYIVLVGARSALLAFCTAVTVIAVLFPTTRWRWPRSSRAAAAGVLAAVLVAGTAASGAFRTPLKAESLRLRAALWVETLKLIRDHPLGVGSGNFLHAFLPYQLADDRLRSEDVVYTSPHNELLRALAEEGVLWVALAAWLLWHLAVALRRRTRVDHWPRPAVVAAAGGAFLAVEALFQFPFALASGCLAAAAVLGLALSIVDGQDATDAQANAHRRAAPLARAAAIALAAVGIVALARLAWSDYLITARAADVGAQARACELNPRNLRACVDASWRHASEGHRRRARMRLAQVLDRSPYYFPAIRLLADESFTNGDERAGCFYAWIYDALFAGRSSLHDALDARCAPALRSAFAAELAVPGYQRFPMTVPAAADSAEN
jgi:hypothetical protein